MMKIYCVSRRFFFGVFLYCLPLALTAQIAPRYFETGRKAMEENDYHAAAFYFQKAIQESPEQVDYWHAYAEANRFFNHYAEAAKAYTKIIQLKATANFPLSGFYLGQMLRAQGKYEEAIKRYENFRKKYPRRDQYALKAEQDIASCKWAIEHPSKATDKLAARLSDSINTPFNELNPIPLPGDTLFFSSLQNIGSAEKPAFLSRLYRTAQQLLPFPKSGEVHIGNGAFNSDFTTFYFTECSTDNEGKYTCTIWESRFDGQNFSTPQPLSSSVNLPGYTNTQPGPGKDRQGSNVLYFCSDRPGGKGGLDIWRSRILPDGSYQAAENLGAVINTAWDEITPFYDVQQKKLYFSSQGHTGYGELDIFFTREGLNVWDIPVNVGYPANSPANDMYFTISPDQQNAYLASNRKGSKFIITENCCNDLYRIPLETEIRKDTSLIAEKPKTPEPSPVAPSVPAAPVSTDNFQKELNLSPAFPFRVYFHNDEPNPNSVNDTTILSYSACYASYKNKQPDYETSWSRNSIPDSANQRRNQIRQWFDQKVDSGFLKINQLKRYLVQQLQSGKKVDVSLGGFCSPLHNNKYNILLGKRRIATVINELCSESDGIIYSSYQKGTLKFIILSQGEESADRSVSDDRQNTQYSVYAPQAAAERRVDILRLRIY